MNFDDLWAIVNRIFSQIRKENRIWGDYTLDLTLDALLELTLTTKIPTYGDYVLATLYRRNHKLEDPIPYTRQPFGHFNYRLYRLTGAEQLIEPFISQSKAYRQEVPRSQEGLVMHTHQAAKPPCILIDSMQDYVSRMARTGELTGDPSFYAESLQQYQLHRNLLRNPEHGLWAQGQGWEWEQSAMISPHSWSRGQGWLLRGLVDTLDALPPESHYFKTMQAYLIELLEALLRCQHPSGFWHALPNLPFTDSMPETSGTALICSALYTALARKWITGQHYVQAAERAFQAIVQTIDAQGGVQGACVGPGPLTQKQLNCYYKNHFKTCPQHGTFSVLYAFSAFFAVNDFLHN